MDKVMWLVLLLGLIALDVFLAQWMVLPAVHSLQVAVQAVGR